MMQPSLSSLPQGISNLQPIIVSSPTTRSGTTLLQRLLCSSDNAIVYGEVCSSDLDLYLNFFINRAMMYQFNRAKLDSSLQRFKQGEVNDWILDLMPNLDGYLSALGNACFGGIDYCRFAALEMNRPIWGFKYPGWTPAVLNALRQMMPAFKLLYIHRDLLDCVKSEKARGNLGSLEEFTGYCLSWTKNLGYVLGLKDQQNVLLVNYADLIGKPETTIQTISDFSGATNIQHSVLNVKVNTFKDANSSNTGYVAPAELTAEELNVVESLSSSLRRTLYG
jgi:Sulfotransferase family